MLAVVGLTASLGNWQLNRAAERLEAQALQDQRAASGPLHLTDTLPDPAEMSGATVTVSGRWLHSKTVLLDNRSHEGQAGFHVFTPLELIPPPKDSARFVLVLRGWAPRNSRDRSLLPAIPEPAGQEELTGRLEQDVEQTLVLGEDEPLASAQRVWQRLDLARFQAWSELSLAPFVVRQTEPADSRVDEGLVRQWVNPGSKVDRHYGYAFQWFAMSAAMLAFWLWLTVRRRVRKTLRVAGRADD